MGYEVIYRYKEAAGEPGAYSDEVKERSVKMGRVTEDIPLEALAAKIMAQLARRNILIVDVEIWEYAKKKVSYKETATGISIRNKRFSFDSGRVVESDDFEEPSPIAEDAQEDFKPVPSPSKDLADRSCPIANKNLVRRPIRHEMYDPEPLSEFKANQKGLKFTKGRKYPIYSESSMGTTVVYKTTDDSGREIDISSEYFVAVGAGLIQQDEGPVYVGAENQKEEINLWGRYESTEMPEIRRK